MVLKLSQSFLCFNSLGIPFSPVSGNKILVSPRLRQILSSAEDMRAFRQICANTLKKITRSNGFSSVHLNFLANDEAFDISGCLPGDSEELGNIEPLNVSDYLRKTSLQYHWVNRNAQNDDHPYLSFEDYLNSFKSKKRITIRRERRYVSDEGNTRLDVIEGRDILKFPGLVSRMFEIYKSTIDKMWYGNLYLRIEFFNLLVKSDFIENLVFIVARSKDCGQKIKSEDIFAGTFNVVSNDTFYGRYWGCLPGQEVVSNFLSFSVYFST